jgi:hypothetical protein
VLYLLSFEDSENEDELNDDGDRQRSNRNDRQRSLEVLSDDDDAFEVNDDEELKVDDNECHEVEIDVERGEDGSTDGCHEVEVDIVRGDRSDVGDGSQMLVYNNSNVHDTSNIGTSKGKEVHSFSSSSSLSDDDDKSYDYPSYILESPRGSDEDVSSLPKCVTRCRTFQAIDLINPNFENGQRFPDVYTFREAIRQYNVLRGKDIIFKKNDKDRVCIVCKDSHCEYRVYGRQVKGEETFQVRSLKPKHSCLRRYKNNIITSTWITDKLMGEFRTQPDLPIKALQEKVKDNWNVDVNDRKLFRARRKAKSKTFGKLDEQYYQLWDYAATTKKTNVGSCVLFRVERPMFELPPRFQRMYISLAAMKAWFKVGCRPVIGVDACFLKDPHKGQLISAVSRDANNMYPIAMTVVEAETKDSCSWFLETLVGDLGQSGSTHGWTFISDRQKVSWL